MSKRSRNTVSSAAVRDVFMACKDEGLVDDNLLASLKLDPGVFNIPESRLPESTLLCLWERLENYSEHSDVGMQIGQKIDAESKGLLASWVSQASTLGEAFDIFLHYIVLMNPAEQWKKSFEGSQITLTLDHRYPTCATERSLTALVTWARYLSGHEFPISQAKFKYSAPKHVSQYCSVFGDSLLFNAPSNSLSFDRKLLQLPIRTANQLLKNIVEDKAKAWMARLSDQASITEQVSLLTKEALAEGKPINVDAVCKRLAKSRQTLYRQLKAEGTDFTQIYDNTRMQLATTLVQDTNISIDAISLQLGYRDSSSFYKAFRRWTQMSPKTYRHRRQ